MGVDEAFNLFMRNVISMCTMYKLMLAVMERDSIADVADKSKPPSNTATCPQPTHCRSCTQNLHPKLDHSGETALWLR